MNVQFKGYKKKSYPFPRRISNVPGMGVRLLNSSADPFRYKRVRSAKRFIILGDHVTNLVFRYKTFGWSGYGCKRVEIIDREEESLLERYGDRLCWH